ncbi:MAG TPA: histidine kinase, partial [Gammaproteobacteria bacterium]|nr:histidine kinase [Gammaproteobacteria bacterium]
FVEAGVDLLAPWAQTMMGVQRSGRWRRALVRPGMAVSARVFRWSLRIGAAELSRRRVQASGSEQN